MNLPPLSSVASALAPDWSEYSATVPRVTAFPLTVTVPDAWAVASAASSSADPHPKAAMRVITNRVDAQAVKAVWHLNIVLVGVAFMDFFDWAS